MPAASGSLHGPALQQRALLNKFQHKAKTSGPSSGSGFRREGRFRDLLRNRRDREGCGLFGHLGGCGKQVRLPRGLSRDTQRPEPSSAATIFVTHNVAFRKQGELDVAGIARRR